MSEDLSHDAHLRAALRHAPDHALAPPAGVNQAILNAARQAHRPPRATVAPTPPVQMVPAHASRWLAWWQRLATPRWAGALATAFVAALGLGLWFDLADAPVLDRPAPMVAQAPASPEPASGAATARGATAKAKPDEAKIASAPAAPPAPIPPAESTDRAKRAMPTDRADARKSDRTEAAARRSRDANTSAAIAQRAPATTTVPRARDQSAAASARELRDGERSGAAPQAAAPPEQPPSALAKAASATVPSLPSSDAMAAQAPSALRLASAPNALAEATPAASPALTLLRRVRAEHAARTARWTWQAPQAGTVTAFDEMGEAWLLRVVQSARGRWSDVADAGAGRDALEVRWWRDGWPHATLRIEADGLRWVEANGRIRYAPMDAAALQRLRAM
jgi:hypothetical protein